MAVKPLKILLVDDEPDVLDFLQYNLEKEGFEIVTAATGEKGLKKAKIERPDIIILDVMLPGMDGIETCRELRSVPIFKSTIIMMLTARGEDYSQIAGLENGADDYITKPVKPRVLTSRIKALTRRLDRNNVEDQFIERGDIKIDVETHMVTRKGEEISLPKKEFKLLKLLMSKPGKVFTRDIIMDKVWGSDAISGDRTIDVHIRKLRQKVGEEYIKTIKGIGYKFKEQ